MELGWGWIIRILCVKYQTEALYIVLESHREYYSQILNMQYTFNANSLGNTLLVHLPLRSLLLRSLTKLPFNLRHLIQSNNPTNLKILLMIPKKPFPMRHLLPHTRPRHPYILLAPDLPLPTAQPPNLLLAIDRDKHLLYTGEIVR